MKKINLLFLSLTFLITINSQLFAQWETIEFSGEYKIRELFTVDNNLFVLGDSDPDKIFLSSNNGDTFTTLSLPDPVTSIECMEGHDGNLFVGTDNGVYASADMGTSWVYRNTGLEDTTITSLRSANEIIYAGGYRGRIYKSADNGVTWTSLNSPNTSGNWVEQIEVRDSLIYLNMHLNFFNNKPNYTIYKSSDYGSTWATSLQTTYIRDFLVNTSGSTIIVGRFGSSSGEYGALYSTDFGNSWNDNPGFEQSSVYSIHTSYGTVFVGNSGSIYGSGLIYRNSSTNDELVNKPDGLYSNAIGDIKNTSTYLFVAYNANSVISRRPLADFGITTDVKGDEVIPTNFVLNQNYPNPFNPSTTISYSIPEASQVSLKVFDALGREVVELVNTKKAAGSYEDNFDALNLSSGIYFYTLRSNQFLQTRKMILIK